MIVGVTICSPHESLWRHVAGVFPFSGVVVLHGANALVGAKLVQGHTYAGASTLAYLTATEILKTLPNWFGRANTLGCMVRLSAFLHFFSYFFFNNKKMFIWLVLSWWIELTWIDPY